MVCFRQFLLSGFRANYPVKLENVFLFVFSGNILALVSGKCPGVCHIFEFCWPLKVTSILTKRPTEHYGDGKNNKFYLNITAYLYPLVHVILRLDGP